MASRMIVMEMSPIERIEPLGEGCALVRLGNGIDPNLNRSAVALAKSISSKGFGGLIEAVPAYDSVAVYFDPRHLAETQGEKSPFEFVTDAVVQIASEGWPSDLEAGRHLEIPVKFGGEAGPDLEGAASRSGLDMDEVIRIFTSSTYRVYMLGFLPGFPYMATVDERIAVPRLETPRTSVPAGSVGIAGNQTGIYPFESPGGWQIIGATSLTIFDPYRNEPAMFRPGDEVTFVSE